jgi:hypothetical protein
MLPPTSEMTLATSSLPPIAYVERLRGMFRDKAIPDFDERGYRGHLCCGCSMIDHAIGAAGDIGLGSGT